MNRFSELSVSALLKSNLEKHGFIEPTPIQAQAIEPALEGRDLVATAQTGSGKTLAFVLPMLETLGKSKGAGVRAVIISPTRELAMQIHETFVKLAAGTGIRAAVVVGGLSERSQLNTIRAGAQVLIATAGRLNDFLMRRMVNLGQVRMLVLDEADRMLDMGFLPTIEKIMAAMPRERQTLFFSATIENSVKHLVERHVPKGVRISVGSTTKPAELVDLQYYEVEQDRKLDLLTNILKGQEGLFLVFSRTKHGAERLSKKLVREGFKSAAIHGDRSQNQRTQALRGFQEGYYRVLVATDVAARGIHVDGIAHVVNFDLPQAPEDFIHRVGRTGRAGARGIATTFGTRAQRRDVMNIERSLSIRLKRCQLPDGLRSEAKMDSAQVIALPAPKEQHRPKSQRPAQRPGQRPAHRSFAPSRKAGRRPARRAAV